MKSLRHNLSSKLILLSIFLFAAALRFFNPNWDQGFHLHPDERFLTLVGIAMKQPSSLAQYLDPATSLFNPANINYKFYVYGMFPVTINKLLAIMFKADDYANFTIIGRLLSAFIDLVTLGFIVKITSLFRKHHKLPQPVIYLSAFFYAITVFAIQQSHFFTVDTFLNCFMLASLYFSLRFYYESTLTNVGIAGLFFALGAASKASAVYILPLDLFFLLLGSLPIQKETKHLTVKRMIHVVQTKQFFTRLILMFVIFGVVSYVTIRLADPYYFKDANFLHLSPNPVFMDNIKQLKALSTPQALFPPSVQWVHKAPVVFALYNLAFWGVGIVYFAFIIIGIYSLLKKHKHVELLAILAWVLLFFLYQSTQFDKTMRYFFFIYPFLALYAGIGFYYLTKLSFPRRWAEYPKGESSSFKHLPLTTNVFLILLLLIYPLAFMSIYMHPVTRVSASKWIFQHVPSSDFLLNEHWDDALPLPVTAQQYPNDLLPVFDVDSPEKWQKMDTLLQKGNYYILSSNRGWGSIPTVPERYPQMKQFYEDLFAGKLQYKKVAEFTSYPSLTYLGIPLTFPDDSAEEAFTVYDHPKVMIFRKM
jgi:hypothetical protein